MNSRRHAGMPPNPEPSEKPNGAEFYEEQNIGPQLTNTFIQNSLQFALRFLPTLVPRTDFTPDECELMGISPYIRRDINTEQPTIVGVVVSPNPEPGQGHSWITRPDSNLMRWLPSHMCTIGFRMLPLAWTVGIPICCTVNWHWPIGANELHNSAVSLLTLNYDAFWIDMKLRKGEVAVVGDKDVKGPAFLFRHDAVQLRIQDLDALLSFVSGFVKPSIFEGKFEIATDVDLRGRIDEIKDKLTPEHFDLFWRQMREERLRAGDASWYSLASPVTPGVERVFTFTGGRRF